MEQFYCPAMNAFEEAKTERKIGGGPQPAGELAKAQTKSTDGSTSNE
jgi:hypothetical protein